MGNAAASLDQRVDGGRRGRAGNPVPRPCSRKTTERFCWPKLQCGVSEMRGWRPTMEDQHICCELLPGLSMFAIFDGHGGFSTSLFLKMHLVEKFQSLSTFEEYRSLPESGPKSRSDVNGIELLRKSLTSSFIELDRDLKELHHAPTRVGIGGSTAIVVLLTPSHIVTANVGDSRAFLRRQGKVLPLSFDHKPNNLPEKQRIVKHGGFVKKKRVDGDLAVSRAFGDFGHKSDKVIVTPEFTVYPRNLAADEFIVLACDGIFDVMSNETSAGYIQSLLTEGEVDLGNICEDVLDSCLERKSRDNMTVMILRFPGMHADCSQSAQCANTLWGERTSRRALKVAQVCPCF